MEELEKLEYPKPNREFVYSTFNAFADKQRDELHERDGELLEHLRRQPA